MNKINLKHNYITCVTPLRISLFGGGTDLKTFIEKNGYGKVINFTINKFIYSSAKIHNSIFNKKYRFNYHETENIDQIKDIRNNIIRNSLKFYKFKNPLYVSTISDIPSGTGLGSSGAFQVSMCNIFQKLLNKKPNLYQIFKEATLIETSMTKSNAGYQDQCSASFGGFNEFTLKKNLEVSIKKFQDKFHIDFLKKLISNSILVYTNKSRKAENILKIQSSNLSRKKYFDYSKNILDLEEEFFSLLMSQEKNIFSIYHELMNESWNIKKKVSKSVTNIHIDDLYLFLKKNGMISGKILGAGGGGFILSTFENTNKKKLFIKKNYNKFKILEFDFYKKGTKIVND